jgi:hypothetical protein
MVRSLRAIDMQFQMDASHLAIELEEAIDHTKGDVLTKDEKSIMERLKVIISELKSKGDRKLTADEEQSLQAR